MARIFIIGPGGVGKTMAGAELAGLLECPFVDLDQAFMARVGHVDAVIQGQGYARYVEMNSALFAALVPELPPACVVALSSGFLARETPAPLLTANRNAVRAAGTSIRLLPSADLAEASRIVVARQMGRGFNLDEARETAKFARRFADYMDQGDIRIFSAAAPAQIAAEVVAALTSDCAQGCLARHDCRT
ncbi:shikimate kinase [Phenylobacterium sp.]|uniref:shikimate kinase n=1 Tax=Phenylobacterium sp. TaxID=1871053 RepID=UPI002719F57D|nr:shikimate kinase [Phenylobacterium sp.]MDO8377506.1 shikimate kinase [Phenylobacterium sp.]